MNHFAKALNSFNKQAVLQKAALGKPEPEAEPEPEEVNPILKLRECDEIVFGRHGLRRQLFHDARPFSSRGIISEGSTDSSEVGAISYNTDRGLRGPFCSDGNEIDRETYRVPDYYSFVIRPALKLSYAEAFKLLRFQIVDRLNKNGQQYLVRLIAPTIPNLHSPLVRKMIGRIIQDLLVKNADYLAPYFAEKFGAAF